MTKHIPNFLTLCNLFCGCLAVLFANESNYNMVLILVAVSAIFDFLDGFSARLLNKYSDIGKELDSLADVISFGFVPAMIAVSLLKGELGNLAYIGLLIAMFSALRLAKFNVDDRQTISFIGLPTPANAIFWVGLAHSYATFFSQHIYLTIALIIISSYALVSEINMFSLKIKNLNVKDNIWQLIFIIASIIIAIFMKTDAILWIIVLYIILSIIKSFTLKKH